MDKGNALTKTLAFMGTGLVWFPIVAPFLFGLARLIRGGRFRFDYLIPAELFPAVVVGGTALLWAALRARSRRGLIAWALGAAAAFLAASQLMAVGSGLASGKIEPSGPWFVLVVAGLIAYCLATVVLGIGGGLLVQDSFRKHKEA